MPRHPYKKNKVKVDPVYKSEEVAKLINYLMLDGKKEVAANIVYSVIEGFDKEGQEGIRVLQQAFNNVAPTYEVKPRRLGGASYLVPTEVRRERKFFLAMNWIIDAARTRSNKEFKSFASKLAAELQDAAKNQGAAIAKRQQTEKLAEANKAFSHLKW